MQELISVIIPVFNVKDYLTECLESVVNQTYKNLEIIIVDDASTDGSSEICDNYAKMDNRIKVFHQEKNQGQSVARNKGIDNSKGNIITFIDSDDFIHERMIEVLYENLNKFNADISFCDFSREAIDKDIKSKPKLIEKYTMYETLYERNNPVVGNCAKLYKKSIFDNIRYPEGKIYEDAFIIHRIIENAEKFVFIDDKLYYWRIRKGSTTEQNYTLKFLDYLDVSHDRMKFMKERKYDYFYAREFYRYINKLKWNYKKIKKHFPSEKGKMKELIIEFNKMYNKKTRKLIMNKRLRLNMDLFYIKSLLLEKYILK